MTKTEIDASRAEEFAGRTLTFAYMENVVRF